MALLALAAVSACTYEGGGVNNPLTRKFEWFSYLGGDDIRATCMPGSPDRFRIIYNATWKEQVRIYELGFGGPRRLDEHVIGPGNLISILAEDPLAPWRGTNAAVTLSDEQYGALIRNLMASGAYVSPQQTLTLASTDFYWTVASCHGGVFHLTGWLYPSAGFDSLKFPQWLQGLDQTGIPFNPPKPWTEVATAPPGSADNPVRGSRTATTWTIGIVQDHLLDQIVF
ncbi:MAG TPA: hypothetical protein VGG27_05920 [Magnetospirillaceae bacterium]